LALFHFNNFKGRVDISQIIIAAMDFSMKDMEASCGVGHDYSRGRLLSRQDETRAMRRFKERDAKKKEVEEEAKKKEVEEEAKKNGVEAELLADMNI
jgi:hypothetical protein